jgi:hypothetical protein
MSSLTRHALNFTPPERLCDPQGRPYFLWDVDVTLEAFRTFLADANPAVRGYWLGKLMRQARPDDAFLFVTAEEMSRAWPDIERHLGQTREFWRWFLGALEARRGA